MLLDALKRELEGIYEIQVPLSVQDFLITDRAQITTLAAAPPADTHEVLYLVEDDDGDGAALSLFIDASVMQRLAADDPMDALHEGNLADFCIAVEGVSHFTYLVWRASHDHSVSELELEVQAEVDKFVTTAMLLGRQCAGQVPEFLSQRLFQGAGFLPGLEPQRRARYERANEYAGRFCEGLERRHMRACSGSAMTRELRRFYRLNQQQKLRHIETAPS